MGVVETAMPVLSLNSLPLGFRFQPSDEDIIDLYLRQKINNNGDDVWVIREIDVCKWEPWELPDFSVIRNKDPEWFFFCPLDRKYPNGNRLKRATGHGYWKATGIDRKIKSGSSLIGMKKTLVFYHGRAPKGKRTNWVMHEYRTTLQELDGTNPGQNPYVICRLFKKHDESIEVSNCGEVEQTASTPIAAKYCPEEVQSDTPLPVVALSSSLLTENVKPKPIIPETSEETTSKPVLSLNSLPIAIRFRPSDEEIIDFYLRQKINGNGDDVWVIREIDVCKWEPWDLPDLSVIRNKDPEWFFFCPQDRKYPNGNLVNRATEHGFWKATGRDRKVKSGSSLIGIKKTLVFYNGRAPRGKRTNWVMHEYQPTLQELDGTNPGQNPYVICRLFKKQDESIEVSNCGEVEKTASTPMAAKYSPEDVQSDTPLPPVAVSSSLLTEDKTQAIIRETSEETTSNIITPVDRNSDEYDAHNAQPQNVKLALEENQLLNSDIFSDLENDLFDDILFSPALVHLPQVFDYQASNEPDGLSGLQYGTNETGISDLFESLTSDQLSYEETGSQPMNYPLFNVKDSGWGSDSDLKVTNMPSMQVPYPEEAMDRNVPLGTAPEFFSTVGVPFDHSAVEQKGNVGLFQNQNDAQMTFSSDVSMGQVSNVVNDYEEPRNCNVSADGDTGIIRRARRPQNELVNTNINQGSANR